MHCRAVTAVASTSRAVINTVTASPSRWQPCLASRTASFTSIACIRSSARRLIAQPTSLPSCGSRSSAMSGAPSAPTSELVKPYDTYAKSSDGTQSAAFSSTASAGSSEPHYSSAASSSAMNHVPSHPRHSPFTSRLLSRPTSENSLFLVCDIQENFRGKMHQVEPTATRTPSSAGPYISKFASAS